MWLYDDINYKINQSPRKGTHPMKSATVATILIICLSVSCAGLSAKDKSAKQQNQPQGTAVPSPLPSVQATPAPREMNTKERWERIQELLGDDVTGPEDVAELREHLTAVANSKASQRQRAVSALTKLPKLEADMPRGEKLDRTRQMCKDLTGPDIAILTDVLKKVLHDPGSLQDFEVEKCAPSGAQGVAVMIRAGYRAKNKFGAFILSQEKFIAVRNSQDGAKYKAVVLPD